MSNRIKVTWQADDGYVTGSRPQTFYIEVEDDLLHCDTEEQLSEEFYNILDTEFRNTVTPILKDESYQEVLEAWKTAKEKEAKDNE